MDKQEYLGFVEILKDALNSIQATFNDLPDDRRRDTEQRFRGVIANLTKAIAAYQDKANALRS